MPSSVRTQASNSFHLIPKFKEGDIVAYPDLDYRLSNGCLTNGSISAYIYKIDCFEQHGCTGLYRCHMWSLKEKKWVKALLGEMVEDDGRAVIQWDSPLERNMEVIERLGLLVKWGIG